MKLLRRLYWLAESGDYWTRTTTSELIIDLELRICTLDEALYYKHYEEIMQGLCATHVEDSLQARTEVYRRKLSMQSEAVE